MSEARARLAVGPPALTVLAPLVGDAMSQFTTDAKKLEQRITSGPLADLPSEREIDDLRALRNTADVAPTIAALKALRAQRLARGAAG